MMQPTPLRPDEQVAGGYLVVSLGGESYELKVLPMAVSRKWLSEAKSAVQSMKGTAGGLDSFEDIADYIAGNSESLMDLLIAYDQLGNKVLPEREWIDTHATDGECYEGWLKVTAATAPLAREVLRIVPDLIPALIDSFRRAVEKGTFNALVNISSQASMKPSPPSTDGRPATSKRTSRTSSSPSTRRKAQSAKRKPPSPSSTTS